ncbi:MAG: tyrosine-type recombinase/integrase [Ignavibacteriae bacterium]|nr:tyrosine-type recombinase/integrase [Ignavibacteriota bacterium]
MFLSKRSNGLYYLWFTNADGNKQKVSTGSSLKSDAVKFLREFKEENVRVRQTKITKTLNEFFADYMQHSQSIHTLKTQHSVKNAFRELLRIVGDVRLDKIGVRELERFIAQKKTEASEWTARKYYIHLASAFQTAIRWNYLVSNPFKKVAKPKTTETMPQYFSKDEMRKLLDTIERVEYRELCLVALYTGLRLGELINLQWSDIDFLNRIVLVRSREGFTTKSRKNRTVPLNDMVYNLFLNMKESASSELVFHSRGKRLSEIWVSKTFKMYVRKAGLNERLHFHSLRHTFASWLVQEGVSLYEVQKLLGHSNISVTQVYAHLQPERLHDTVNKIFVPMN